jgi:type II secretory pathway component PulC
VVAAALLVGVAGCASRTPPLDPNPYDQQDEPRAAPSFSAPPRPVPARDDTTGVIPRAALDSVLAAGPGRLLAGIEIRPVHQGKRFVGWRIERFAPAEARLRAAPLRPGDVVLTINDRQMIRPEDLYALFSALRQADEIVIRGERAGAAFSLRYVIE